MLAAGLALSFALQRDAAESEQRSQRAHFDGAVREIASGIHRQMAVYASVLRGAAIYAEAEHLDQADFINYWDILRMESVLPGIRSAGFSVLIPAKDKAQRLAALRERGFAKTDIRPAGERAAYAPIAAIYPRNQRNLPLLGFDQYSDPVRREAMERSRDLGSPVLSRKVTLIQASEGQAKVGSLLLAPVYRRGAAREILAERRAAVVGWVYFGVRAADLLASARTAATAGIDIDIFDGESASADTLLAGAGAGSKPGSAGAPRFSAADRVVIGGQVWTVNARSTPALEAAMDLEQSGIVRNAGIALSLLLSLIVWNLNGRAEQAQAMARELTRELQESTLRWKFAVEGSGDGMWDWNLPDGKVFFSPRWKAILGFAAHEIGGGAEENISRIHPEDRASVNDAMRATLSGGTPALQAEFRVRCKDGGWKWVLDRGVVVSRDPEGRALRMVGTRTDITGRRHEEERLRNLARAVEQSPVATMITDTEGRIEYVNPAFCGITGYARDEAVGKIPSLLKSGLTPLAVYQDLWATIKAGGVWKGEMQNRRKNGELYWESEVVSAVENARGEIVNFVAAKEDITLRVRNEAAVLEIQQHLAEMVAERTAELRSLARELLASEARERRTVAEDLHDGLGQSLAVAKLKLTSLVLPAGGGETREYLRQLREIESMIDRSSQSVRSLATQLSPPVLYQFGLCAALEWLAEEMAGTYGLGVKLRLGDIPPLDETLSSALFRIVRELLINVWKHAEVSEAEVDLSMDAASGKLSIRVADAGVGFDVAQLLKPPENHSFGLFSIKERIALIGGALHIDSQAGKGTTVTFALAVTPDSGVKSILEGSEQ